MPWVTLTKDRIHRRLTASEIKNLQTLQKEPGETYALDQGVAIDYGDSTAASEGAALEDPMQESIDETVSEIRADIASSKNNNLNDDAATIPKSLVGAALSIIVFKLYSRLGGELLDIGETRQKLYDEARSTLERVRSGDQAIPEATGTTFQVDKPRFKSDKRLKL